MQDGNDPGEIDPVMAGALWLFCIIIVLPFLIAVGVEMGWWR